MMLTTEKLTAMKAALKDGKAVQAMGGIVKTVAQSDKIGFDWVNTTINDVVVMREYREQENPVGTSAENPIPYTEGETPLINNAFYLVDGAIKVWMEEWVDWTSSGKETEAADGE